MKKLLVLLLAMTVLLGCACSKKAPRTGGDDDTDETGFTIKFDYPDQLKYVDGGTADMTIYKCGVLYYACIDGSQDWSDLYNQPPVDIEEGEFVHLEVDFKLVYGGVDGYWGAMYVTKVRNERVLTLNEVVDCRMLTLYDVNEGNFAGARLIVKDGKNYMICRDPMRQYRLYDDGGNCLCTYDTAMAAAAYLDEGSDQNIEFSSPTNIPYMVIRIGDVYYANSRYSGSETWTPLLNLEFENKPVGFELEDGQAMKISSTRVYMVNGGEAGYVNAPMFERMDNFSRTNYAEINAAAAYDRWEITESYENGMLYSFRADGNEYLIFYIDDCFYVYREIGDDLNTGALVGIYPMADEVNAAIGK